MCACGVWDRSQETGPRTLPPAPSPAQESCLLVHQRWRVCTVRTAALALFPVCLCSQTSWQAAGLAHTYVPDPPSLWFSNCRKVH